MSEEDSGSSPKRAEKRRNKIDYYRESRSELVNRFLENLESPKEPAVTGTIIVTPIIVTLAVVAWLFEKLNQIPGNKYFDLFQTDNTLLNFYLNQSVKLTMLLIFGAIVVTGVGRFVKTRAGFRIERDLDSAVDRIPFLGTVYNITKVTAETVLSGPEGFRQPAKIDVNGLQATVFRTGNISSDGREVVFLPTSPNITTGFVLEVEKHRLKCSDETAEDALTRVLSAGFGSSNRGEEKTKNPERTDR